MYSIHATNWEKVKSYWEQWQTYDLANPVATFPLDPNIEDAGVYVDLSDILKFEDTKTFVFKDENEILGVLQIEHFPSIRNVAGIKNVAVKHQLRNNGIGSELMKVANIYIKHNRFDLAMLYSSLYASQINFYEKFGYNRHETQFTFPNVNGPRKIHLKFYNDIDLPADKLNTLIQDVGKF